MMAMTAVAAAAEGKRDHGPQRPRATAGDFLPNMGIYRGSAPERSRTSTSLFSSQGPQPCASTSSATGACGPAILDGLLPSAAGATLRTCVPVNEAVRRWTATAEEMTVDLTKRQKEIFDFIRTYASKTGYPPTVREIGKAVGLHSSSTVHAHLANLEKVGLLRRAPTKPRAIELLVGRAKRAVKASSVPVVGQVAAGEPLLAEENIDEYLELPPVIGGDQADFVLQIKGDSMKDAGIIDGDFVVVQQANSARNGEIVVALLEDEATVKRFFREKDRVRLQPANKDYKPIRTRDAQVLGRVVGVFRRV